MKKYLLYAIGEVLLVMIGILLAFQVNTWNDNKIKKKTEYAYYQNIRDQIENDKSKILGQLKYNNRYLTQFEYANNIIEANDRSKIDTLGLIVPKLTEYSDFDRQGNIYETMVNSGQIKFLQNYEIVNGIRELEEKYLYINRIENIHYDAMMNYVIPAIMPAIRFLSGKVEKTDELYSFQFQNLIQSIMKVMKEKNQIYQSTIDEIDRIVKLIEKELK